MPRLQPPRSAEIRTKLARHRYQQHPLVGIEDADDETGSHAALLAAIGTPDASVKGDDSSTEASSDSTDDDASSSDTPPRSSADESSSTSGSSSSSAANDDSSGEDDVDVDGDPFAAATSDDDDDLEGAGDASRQKNPEARPSMLATMAEQTSPDSPLRYLDDILDGGNRPTPTGSSPDASPNAILNRLLSGSTPVSRNSGGSASSSAAPGGRTSAAPPRGSLAMLSKLHAGSAATAASAATPADGASLRTVAAAAGSGPMLAIDGLNFRKGREVGKGGFGVVFQAILEDGRLAAVKQLPATDQKGIEKEMRVMCSLPPHPHCVQYLGVKRTSRHVYMVMEYVSGGSIMSLRRTVGPLPESLARRYIHMTLLGLVHLHSHHLIHQDIKGANVLLDERGVAKIADFGCIKVLSATHASQSGGMGSAGAESTQGGAGTPLWMAPEVCRGEYPSKRSDIWSLGCLFLEMTNETGTPWSFRAGTTLQGAAYAIGSAARPPPFPSQLSTPAKSFLECCLAVLPNKRHSAEQLLQHPFFTNEPTSLHSDPNRADVDPQFFATVQSVASSGGFRSLLTTQTTTGGMTPITAGGAVGASALAGMGSFILEAVSDDDDDDDHPPVRLKNPLKGSVPLRQGSGAAPPGNVVWRSEGTLRVAPVKGPAVDDARRS